MELAHEMSAAGRTLLSDSNVRGRQDCGLCDALEKVTNDKLALWTSPHFPPYPLCVTTCYFYSVNFVAMPDEETGKQTLREGGVRDLVPLFKKIPPSPAFPSCFLTFLSVYAFGSVQLLYSCSNLSRKATIPGPNYICIMMGLKGILFFIIFGAHQPH